MNKKRKKIFFWSLVLIIFFLALFLRIYKIGENLLFVYDQARDALLIQKIIKEGKLTLIGPVTGIPGFFLGPFYYYLILPFYWLGSGSPLVPVIFLILLSMVGIFICGFFSWKVGSPKTALLTIFLLSLNYGHIFFSRWLSNPNPILILAPLYFLIIFLWISKSKNSRVKAGLAGFLLSLCLQTELANAIFFIPTTILIFIFYHKKFKIPDLLLFFSFFLIGISPLILFNLRHDFIMITALKNFFNQTSEKITLLEILRKRPVFYFETLTFFITPKAPALFVFSLTLIVIYLIIKRFWKVSGLVILTAWLFLPLVFSLLYQSNKGIIWDYYLISQLLPFLILLGLSLNFFREKQKRFGNILLAFYLIIFVWFNLAEWKIYQSKAANRISFGVERQVVEKVYEQAAGNSFNFEAFVPNLLPVSYEYLFDWYGEKKFGYKPTPEYDKREKLLFFIMEPGQEYVAGEQYWRNVWYNQRKSKGKIIWNDKIGEIDIEKRIRENL